MRWTYNSKNMGYTIPCIINLITTNHMGQHIIWDYIPSLLVPSNKQALWELSIKTLGPSICLCAMPVSNYSGVKHHEGNFTASVTNTWNFLLSKEIKVEYLATRDKHPIAPSLGTVTWPWYCSNNDFCMLKSIFPIKDLEVSLRLCFWQWHWILFSFWCDIMFLFDLY